MINTVTGPIDASQLGFTLMHEHFLLKDSAMNAAFPNRFDRNAYIQKAVRDVRRVMDCGVKTIVDATPIDLGRDVALILEIADRTGIQVIVSTGFYYNEKPWFEYGADPDRLVELLAGEIETGIQGTSIRAGVIKCATDAQGLTPVNAQLLIAAARLCRYTGVPIITHAHACSRNGLLQQEIFDQEGVDLKRVMIGHCDDTEYTHYHRSVAKNGSYIGMDRLVINWAERTKTIVELCNMGLASQIMLSHDCEIYGEFGQVGYNRATNGQSKARNWRIIPEHVLPALRAYGIPEEQIGAMAVDNPRRFFGG